MSKSTLRIATLLAIFGVPLILQPRTALSGDSCNALLTLGLYNVTQSSSAQDGNNLALSTFCSYDYSSSQTSTERRAAIRASFFGLFGGGVSGGTADSEIVTTQHQLCTSGYNSSAYSNQASAYARTVYQGTLDAWNKCQALSLRGLDFNVLTSSTLQGVTIMIKAATGVSARFSGLYQDGLGTSVCKRTLPPPSGSSVGTAVTVNDTTSFAFSAAQLVTISCQRTMQEDADGNYFADAQDLTIVTSADSLRIPLAAIGSLASSTVEQVTAQIAAQTAAQIQPINVRLDRLSAPPTLHWVDKKLGTIYQNTTGKTMYVGVTTQHSALGTTTFFSDSTPSASLPVAAQSGGPGWWRFSSFVVPPNYYYRGVANTGGSVSAWVEWY